MRFLPNIFKKTNTKPAVLEKPSQLERMTNSLYKSTGDKIKKGLAKETASTGTPIKDLHGAAKTMSMLSNIGGGSKKTGGGGIAAGMDTMIKHEKAKTAKKIIDSSKQKRLK